MAETVFADEPLRIHDAYAPDDPRLPRRDAAPGTWLGLAGDALRVACGAGELHVTQLQRAGRKVVAAREFVNSTRAACRPLHVSGARTEVLVSAARVIAAVVDQGASADAALASVAASAERAAVRAIALGSVRWYLRLLPAVHSLLDRKAGRLAPEVSALLVAAAHQIEYSRNPAQLTVNAAVNAARTLGQARAAGLVNALLRRFVRERAALLARVDVDPVAAAAHPPWLAAALRRAWPQQAAAVMMANNAHPPMTLRVDVTRTDRDAYLALLRQAGIEARASRLGAGGRGARGTGSGRRPCPILPKAGCRFRTRGRSWPPRCSMPSPGCASWMRVRRRAARRCISWSAPADLRRWSRPMRMPRA